VGKEGGGKVGMVDGGSGGWRGEGGIFLKGRVVRRTSVSQEALVAATKEIGLEVNALKLNT